MKNNNSNLNNIVFRGPVQLNFILKFNDPLFLNITDIPFQYRQKFILTTTEDDQKEVYRLTGKKPILLEDVSPSKIQKALG